MDRGQYVAYTFYKTNPAWRRLPIEERTAGKDAFAEAVEVFAPRFEHLRAYSCTGVRPDCDFFLWKISERYELLGELGAALNATPLSGWLDTPYSYLATTKASQRRIIAGDRLQCRSSGAAMGTLGPTTSRTRARSRPSPSSWAARLGP